MRLPGRLSAAIEILAEVETRHRPVSEALKGWGIANRFAGAGDRAAIGNLVYDALRRRASHAFAMVTDAPRALILSVAIRDWGEAPEGLTAAFADDPHAPAPLTEDEIARLTAADLTVVTKRAPSMAELADLRFAFRVAKHVKSNTIVYAKDLATVGIGAGQMSRVDSARIAARKAEDAAKELGLAAPMTKGSVVASDAFFPFADGLLVAIEAGATAVIQPGGSMRDNEVIEAADKHGIAMVFTGTRHFRH